MGLPSKKRTPCSKKQRASHFALKSQNIIKCDKCSSPKLPHKACPKCGEYKGKKTEDKQKRQVRALRRKKKIE